MSGESLRDDQTPGGGPRGTVGTVFTAPVDTPVTGPGWTALGRLAGHVPVLPATAVPDPALAPLAALESLDSVLAFDARDWAAVRGDAWLYGVVVGWDCEDAHVHDPDCHGAMDEVAARHRWGPAEVARLRALRAGFRHLRTLAEAIVPEPA